MTQFGVETAGNQRAQGLNGVHKNLFLMFINKQLKEMLIIIITYFCPVFPYLQIKCKNFKKPYPSCTVILDFSYW